MRQLTAPFVALLLALGQTATASVTLLVDFGPFTKEESKPAGRAKKTPSTADDFAVATPRIDPATPINNLALNSETATDGQRSNNLTGTGITADLTYDTKIRGYTARGGAYNRVPLLGSYLFTSKKTASVTVSSLEEIPAGQTVTVAVWGGGDKPGQDTTFSITHNGVVSSTQTVKHGESPALAFRVFTFVKAAGAHDVRISYGNPDNHAGFGGFSITSAPDPGFAEPE